MTTALNQIIPALVSHLLLLPANARSLSSTPDNSSEGRLEGTGVLLCVLDYQCVDKILSPEFETKSIKLTSLKNVKTKAITK